MTRGKIIFIEKNLQVYSTIEFNGDMYPCDGGHGEEIVGFFQRHGFSDLRSYEHYVKKFDEKNFGYSPAYGMELKQFKGIYREDIFDFTDNYTDYLYLINRSGRDICVKLEEGVKTIPDAALAIIYFQSLYEIVPGNDIDETGVADGSELTELMNSMNWNLFARQKEWLYLQQTHIEKWYGCEAAALPRGILNMMDRIQDAWEESQVFDYD